MDALLIPRLTRNVPGELTALCQWVVWRRDIRDGKPTKVPYCALTAAQAKSNDPGTWSSFEDACRAYGHGCYEGVGFVFSASDPYTGIDLDGCLQDREPEPWAREIIRRLNSYTEVTPSGRGVHIIVSGPHLARGRKRSEPPVVEMYSSGRFFTMTGDLL